MSIIAAFAYYSYHLAPLHHSTPPHPPSAYPASSTSGWSSSTDHAYPPDSFYTLCCSSSSSPVHSSTWVSSSRIPSLTTLMSSRWCVGFWLSGRVCVWWLGNEQTCRWGGGRGRRRIECMRGRIGMFAGCRGTRWLGGRGARAWGVDCVLFVLILISLPHILS